MPSAVRRMGAPLPFVLALALVGLVACTGDGGGDPLAPDTGPRLCDEGARRCSAMVVEICDDGDWTPLGLCDATQICRDGACVAGPCTPACEGAECGPDGCGGVCGACGAGSRCVSGRCEAGEGCGDGACGGDEDCTTCPADCGQCCGDGACTAEHGEDCARCLADCPCAEGERCDGATRACAPGCVPIDCEAVQCGDDGCGGDCGQCPEGAVCAAGACVAVAPPCGDGRCGAGEDCLRCPADCGPCCGDAACTGDHGEDCATCPLDCACGEAERCDVDARVCAPVCVPDCDGAACGPDGCGGACGACMAGWICDARGACVPPPPRCGDATCAADEDCATCPADCGSCCGDGQCTGRHGESCATCPADCGCGEDEACDVAARRCAPVGCEPACFGRICGPDGCGGLCGLCDPGELCEPDRGRCVVPCAPQCDGLDCGPDGCGGTCGACAPGEDCEAGICRPPCVPDCTGRICGPDGCGGTCDPGCGADEACTLDGRCVGGALGCDCRPDEQCVAGMCRPPEQICGPGAPGGFCRNGELCLGGACVDGGQGCSLQRPAGVCPVGALCIGGGCRAFSAAALCDDGNPCTADVYDPARDACVHVDQAAPCSDGDGCTQDTCVDGRCVGAPIDDCIAAPTIDPWISPTNLSRLELRGDRPPGTAVLVDGAVAAPEGPAARWSVVLDLAPGENRFRVSTRDGAIVSAEREVRVVYDPDPPATRITPGGGVFRDGITVTVASTEPATVYYTTDGSRPTEWSPRFESLRTFRVFDDTTLSVRARDRAGNWQPEPRVERYEIAGHADRWLVGPPLPASRVGMAAASDGARIFVAGGSNGAVEQTTALAYEPATGAWRALAPLATARTEAAAAWVGDALYVFGGRSDGVPLNRVDRLRPDEPGNWAARRALPSTRFGLAAVAVGARVHVFGGQTNGGAVLDTHEVYDTLTDTWSNAVPPMPRPRYAFAAVRAADGRVYLIGGEDEAGRPIAEVDAYDPVSAEWSARPAMPTPRTRATVGLVGNIGAVTGGAAGVLVSGGRTADGRPSAVVEEYVVDDGRWRPRRPLPAPRVGAAGATVDGPPGPGELDAPVRQAWVIGGAVGDPGAPSGVALHFTRDQDHLRRLTDLPAARARHAAVAIDDRLYVVGGDALQGSTRAWRYDAETGLSTAIADLPESRVGAAAVALGGRLWLIGGEDRFGAATPTVHSYDPADDAWTAHRPMLNARRDAVAVVLGGEIAVIGGDNGGPVQSVEFYDPAADRWRNGPILPAPRAAAAGAAWQGRIYVAGGLGADGRLLGDVLELSAGAWSVVVPDGFRVAYAGAAVINGRLILFGGRGDDGQPSDRRRVLDLARGFVRHYALHPDTRLLDPIDRLAAVAHNGEVYLIGGNPDANPRPGGLPTVRKYAGRCLDGEIGAYEGRGPYDGFPDLGAGCGEATPTIALDPAVGYGHHGSCEGGWNECRDARTCADLACAWFGHRAAYSFQVTSCPALPSGDCDLFRGFGAELDTAFAGGCNVAVVTRVVCFAQQAP